MTRTASKLSAKRSSPLITQKRAELSLRQSTRTTSCAMRLTWGGCGVHSGLNLYSTGVPSHLSVMLHTVENECHSRTQLLTSARRRNSTYTDVTAT